MSNAIKEILSRLNETQGVKGSAVVTADGIMIASALADQGTEDSVAGLVSFLVATTRRSLAEGGLPSCSRFRMYCTHGKIVLCDLGESCLVTLADQFTALDSCLPAIDTAVSELGVAMRLG